MKRPEFLPHQIKALKKVEGRDYCLFALGMGLGKTFVMTEQLLKFGNKYNLVIVQKSKVEDWVEHLRMYTDYDVIDYTKERGIRPGIIVINYDLVWRREELRSLRDFTLLLDESSKVQHENTRQAKFILSLRPKNVIMGTGSLCNGKYENLYSQIKLLGVLITKTYYWDRYIDYEMAENIKWVNGTYVKGKPYRVVKGYKNIEELKYNLRMNGAVFMLTDDVLDLPEKTEQVIKIKTIPEYKRFKKDRVVIIDGVDYVGDTALTMLLRARQLCSSLNKNKLDALSDLLESTEDRLIIFYNFKDDYTAIANLCNRLGKPISFVNGEGRDLAAYESEESSVTLIQFQSGSHGLNLQKANKMVFFNPPLSAELYSQAKARIHRLGQSRPCFYWYLTCKDSVEERIYETLERNEDYTLNLFKEDF